MEKVSLEQVIHADTERTCFRHTLSTSPSGRRLAWITSGTLWTAPILSDTKGKVIALGAASQATPASRTLSAGTEYGGRSYCWVGESHLVACVDGRLFRVNVNVVHEDNSSISDPANMQAMPHLEGTLAFAPHYDERADALHVLLEYDQRRGMRRALVEHPLAEDVSALVPLVQRAGHTFFNDNVGGGLYTAWDTMVWEDGRVYLNGDNVLGEQGGGGTGEQAPACSLCPSWSPDGNHYAFMSDRDGHMRLYIDGVAVSEEGIDIACMSLWSFGDRFYCWLGNTRIFTFYQSGGDFVPSVIDLQLDAKKASSKRLGCLRDREDTVTQDVCATFDGESVIFRLHNSQEDKVVALHLASGEQTVLHDQALPYPAHFPAPERLEFTTSDGFKTWGHFFAPFPNDGTSKSPPDVFFYVHGGPTSTTKNRRSTVTKCLQLKGYAVFVINYRGSLGMGSRFRRALNGAWGTAEIDDCLAALQMMTDRGKTSTIAAIGGVSAGAYSAQRALVYKPDAFCAGVSVSGLSRLCDTVDPNTHLLEAMYNWSLVGPEGDPQYQALEPLPQAEKIRAPLLLIHAADDDVCPIQDSRDMAKGSPHAQLLEYSTGGHGVGSHVDDWLPKMIEFLQKAFKDANDKKE